MKKIEIVLIEKNEILRKGLSKLLEENSTFLILGDYRNFEESKDVLQNQMPDVVILGLENEKDLKEIFTNNPALKVIGLSENTNVDFIANLLKEGMTSYLLKTTCLKEVVKTIQNIGEGNIFFPTEISSLLFQHLSQPTKKINTQKNSGEVSLTPREMEILKYITDEFTNKEIAKKLFISPRTVDAHRRNLLSKLEARNTVGLVKYYMRLVGGQQSFTF